MIASQELETVQILPETFVGDLFDVYETALNAGDLVYGGESAESEVLERDINGSTYLFHLTKLKSLLHRPEQGDLALNPFEKPEPELTVLDSFGEQNEFRIVLNKFPVAPAHFMLITKEFKSQNTPLSPNELLSTFRILRNLATHDKRRSWFVFYNCGPESGASQPHKHLQFMRLPEDHHPFAEDLAQTSESFIPNQTREPLQDAKLPFAHFVAKLPTANGPEYEEALLMTFYALLQRVLNVLKDHNSQHISYNFCATSKYMMLVPRSAAKYEGMGINSCGFMGLVLCKNDELWDLTKKRGFETVLQDVGFPNTAGSSFDEYSY